MHTKRFVRCGKAVVSAALSMGMLFSQTPIALAEDNSSTNAAETTEAQPENGAPANATTPNQSIEKVTEEMTKLYIEAEQSQYDLISVTKHLTQTEDLISEIDVRIEQSSKDLRKAKENLSQFVSNDYKQGNVSLLDILFNSTSFDDLISRITYANKVAEHQRDAIKRVDTIYALLTRQKSDLEAAHEVQKRYISEQEERTAVADNASAAAVAFIQALPEETVQQLASADTAQREAAMQASLQLLSTMNQSQLESIFGAQPSEGEESGSSSSAPSGAAAVMEALITSGGSVSSEVFSDGGSESYAGATSGAISGGSSGNTSGSYTGYSDLLSRVYSLLGSGYQWSGYNYTGDNSTSSFTCSGVVDYGLGRDSRSSSPETLYEEVGSNITTDVSQFQEGDLVFYSYGGRSVGHVGVYIGDGQIIDSIPNGGVAIRDVNYMDVVGGGSIGGGSSYSYEDYESSYSDYDSYYDYSNSYSNSYYE